MRNRDERAAVVGGERAQVGRGPGYGIALSIWAPDIPGVSGANVAHTLEAVIGIPLSTTWRVRGSRPTTGLRAPPGTWVAFDRWFPAADDGNASCTGGLTEILETRRHALARFIRSHPGASAVLLLYGAKVPGHPDGGFNLANSEVRRLASMGVDIIFGYCAAPPPKSIDGWLRMPTGVRLRNRLDAVSSRIFVAGHFDVAELVQTVGLQPNEARFEVPGDFRYTQSLWELHWKYELWRDPIGSTPEGLLSRAVKTVAPIRQQLAQFTQANSLRSEIAVYVIAHRVSALAVRLDRRELKVVAESGAALDVWFYLNADVT